MKLNKCCFCIELRIGCIILAVVEIVLSILVLVFNSGWTSIIAAILSIIANCCLLYSAAYVKGSNESRRIIALVYIVYVLISAILLTISIVLLCIDYYNHIDYHREKDLIKLAFALGIRIGMMILYWHYCLVVYSWSQKLKDVVVVSNA